jgi:Protein of unknown function (DUF2628)
MAIFTVHEPPPRRGRDHSDPTRIAFVRDGFSFWAFLLGPLWMLWHRLWLVLLGYIVIVVVAQVGLSLAGAPEAAKALVSLLIAVLVGLEASSLRRFSLRRWKPLGVVVADDRNMAERRFFDAWLGANAGAPAPAATLHVGTPGAAHVTRPPDVLGLFPQPGARA